MAGLAARPGVTGSPILTDTLTYVEARVVSMLDAEWWAGGRLRSGAPLALSLLREHLPKEWLGEWAASRERQVAEAWRRRGLR